MEENIVCEIPKLHKYCILMILSHSDIKDIPNLSLVSKQINEILKSDLIWEKIVKRDFKQHFYKDVILFSNWKECYKWHFSVKKKKKFISVNNTPLFQKIKFCDNLTL